MKLDKYNKKRNFKKTNEPKGVEVKSRGNIFVVQHHIARKDHYDFRLELNGVLVSFAIPKGPSYNIQDKRLAIKVEDHPYSYKDFEGVIPKGNYGAGVVQLWDKGTWECDGNPSKGLDQGVLKFRLDGKRLRGKWSLVHFKDENWLLIKEKDGIKGFKDINYYKRSIVSNKTIEEIKKTVEEVNLTSPDKIMNKKSKVTKKDIYDYYKKVSKRILPLIEKRIISVVRCPNGTNKFFKKHLKENKYLGKKEDFYYIKDIKGLLEEVQLNTIEFHIWGSRVETLENPDMMVFDLDPDLKLNLERVREGVRDLKQVLDEFGLKSYLKTSGGKGYHVIVFFNGNISWDEFRSIAKNIADLMVAKWPEKYTSNIRKNKRKGKIFIDYIRNTRGQTFVSPYSLRARDKITVSMPIKWSELDKIDPDSIDIEEAIKRLKRKDPWGI